jgi:hypothetical protein
MKFRTTEEIANALSERFDALGVAKAGELVSMGVPMVYVEIPNTDAAVEVIDFLCESRMKGGTSLTALIADAAEDSRFRASSFTHQI